MRTMRASELVDFFTSSLGASGQEDNFYFWIEEALNVIREQRWPWNWRKQGFLTKTGSNQALALYSWTEGDEFVVCNAAVSTPTTMTGRRVLLGDEWYTCEDFGLRTLNRIYVDRPILGSATDQQLKFYRSDLALKTTAIRDVKVNARKLPRYSKQYFTSDYFGTTLEIDVSTPMGYVDNDARRLDPPAYAPVCVDSAVVLPAFPAGDYYYFYTRYDAESGLESPPGPVTRFTSAGGKKVEVKYGNPFVPDQGERTSYGLRLYRSTVDPTRSRAPMFLIDERTAAVPGTPFRDTHLTVRGLPPLWEGNFVTLEFIPPPDDTRLSVVVEMLDTWGFRLWEEEQVALGADNQVIELLRIFLAGVLSMSSRNPAEYRQAVIHFRSQMAWLASESRASGETDYGPENRIKDYPGENTNSDWVDALPWKV